MPLNDVVDAIRHARMIIRDHRESVLTSETSTRYAIIDPILRALGWQIHNPRQCEVSYQIGQQGFVDYALFNRNGEPIVLIEAKNLGINPVNNEEQLSNYASGMRSGLAVLTNGQAWLLYNMSKRGAFGNKYADTVDIYEGDRRQAAQRLNRWLRKLTWW